MNEARTGGMPVMQRRERMFSDSKSEFLYTLWSRAWNMRLRLPTDKTTKIQMHFKLENKKNKEVLKNGKKNMKFR